VTVQLLLKLFFKTLEQARIISGNSITNEVRKDTEAERFLSSIARATRINWDLIWNWYD
jgi:hypothetical protein